MVFTARGVERHCDGDLGIKRYVEFKILTTANDRVNTFVALINNQENLTILLFLLMFTIFFLIFLSSFFRYFWTLITSTSNVHRRRSWKFWVPCFPSYYTLKHHCYLITERKSQKGNSYQCPGSILFGWNRIPQSTITKENAYTLCEMYS